MLGRGNQKGRVPQMTFKESRRARPAAPLGDRVARRLKGYAVAAGAAGVGLLAAAPASAEIVYTPADHTCKTYCQFYLDVNHDGTNDFLFQNEAGLGLGSTTFLLVDGLNANGLPHANRVVLARSQFKSAADLAFGAPIGPGAAFSHSASMAFAYNGSIGGPWANAQHRYLGLKFLINGQVHYGWAEFSVSIFRGSGHGIQAQLEGYAYDTVPNQAVYAGERGGSAAARQPATLGLLALGSTGRAVWARKEGV